MTAKKKYRSKKSSKPNRSKTGSRPEKSPSDRASSGPGAKKRTKPKPLKKWERELLDTEIKPTFIALWFNDQGAICAVPIDQAQQHSETLREMSDQDRDAYLREAGRVRDLNPKLLKKTAIDAMTALLTWAIAVGECEYGEWLTPRDQRDLLELFYWDAFDGIKEIKLQKQRYEIHDQAYEFAKPYLERYRKARGIPNDQRLTPKQGKEAWATITTMKKWARLVEKHARAARKVQQADPLTTLGQSERQA